MLIDDITIRVKAGNGGRGAVAFNKNKMMLGPVGGNGGRGGSIYFEGVSDLSALSQFRNKKEIKAGDGQNGRGDFVDGPDGGDVVVQVPIGTTITNLTTGGVIDIVKTSEKVLVARCGYGGKGNYHYRSSTNTRPKQFGPGTLGQEFTLQLQLKLIADVGFVGLPNAGKSSLLNELTGANSKVANYAFTTLEPNLGAYYELIIADIPGLIEGASDGKGLGIKFLKHVERTKILFHLVSAESGSPVKDYKVVRKELKKYSKELDKKKEYLFLSKYDMVPEKDMKKKLIALKKLNKNAIPISIHDIDTLEKVKKILNRIKGDK